MKPFRSLTRFLYSTNQLNQLTLQRNFYKSAPRYLTENADKDSYNIGEILTSTKLQTPAITAVPSMYRCFVNDPLRHDFNHVGKFYKIEDSDFKVLNSLNTCLENEYLMECKAFKENCLMIRKPAVEIINYLRQLDYSKLIYKFILYGNSEGVGKRLSAFHVMHYCLKDNWMLFTVPELSVLFRSRKLEFEPSSYKEDRYNTPLMASKFLKHFYTQNEVLLKNLNLKTTKEYKWSNREKTAEGTKLIDLFEYADSRVKYASDVCGVLVREIKLQAKEKQFKVLVFMNQINSLFGQSRVYLEDKTMVKPSQLAIAHNFKKLLRNDWTNGVVLGIVNSKGHVIPGPNVHKRYYDNTIKPAQRRRVPSKVHYEGPLTPLALLKREGFYELEPFIPIEVSKYSNEELSNHFEYYKDRNWIQNPLARDDEGREELSFLSGRNPAQFRRVCSVI